MKLPNFIHFLVIHCALISICSGSCNFHGKSFENGEMWNSSCNICQCHSKSISCTKVACPVIDCNSNEIPSHNDNCCSSCNSLKKACSDGESSHVHNDVWFSASGCILNQCQDGVTVPYIIHCPSIVCPKDKAGNLRDECTEQPLNTSRACMPAHGLTENLAAVNKDTCTLCIYGGSVEKCFIQKCPLCSVTSSSFENHSCCSCSQNTCAKECESCSILDQNYCTECVDLDKVLFEGKCVKKCPVGYFSDENNECKNCSPSCKTCFGNMTSQCSSCSKGYLLQKGRCVKSCDANYYSSNNFCLECHESCLSCHGPNSSDCISCPLPGQLLQDGSCVDNCTGHYYVSDGYCLECNVSCARCLKDGTCQYCEHEFYLEEGYCEPECTPGNYIFLEAYCLACHEECQSCFGPLPFQCITCSYGQFLLENSCVFDCGQGYFGDLGAGICRTCHEDCRACLGGPSKDKCLACSNGYLLPYIGTQFGHCVEQCPSGYFLTANGICEVCHESCEKCFGANDTDCLLCSGSLFFKDGRCVPHCSNGYFQEHGQCYACHPSCETCYGFNDDECYTCPSGRTLKFDKCIPSCGEGKYMDLSNICKDCDPSCQDCTLNSTDVDGVQCLKCKYPQLSIMHGQCLIGCPPNFYLNPNKMCLECHPTCATCERNGATACVTCWDGNFLTHLGTCEAKCHRGYFPANGVCQACDSNCHHCDSASECLHCKGGLVLQFGECVHQCSDQHFVEGVSRKCTECSWECNTCRGPSSDDCTSCIDGKLFQVGSCVNDCSDGYFEKLGICEPCNLKCKSCSSVDNCTSCDLPLLLHSGECVDDCGSGQYADYEALQCKPCTIGCAYCLGPDECGLCFDGFYYYENTCLKLCPENHFPDPYSRICKRNVGAPYLYINDNLIIRVESYILITTALLNVSDPESEKLFVLVSDMPQNSSLVRMSDKGEEIVMKPGDNFTSNQLEDGWVFFKQYPGLAHEGNLNLKVSDGHLVSNEMNLPLRVASKYSPRISQVRYIVMPEESLITINSSFIFLDDKDNLEDVSLNVIQSSCNGKIVLMPNEKESSKITYAQFSQNQLAYKSSKSNVISEASFVLQAFDGFNSVMTDVKVIIIPKDRHGIVIVRNKPFYVKNDVAVALTNDVLLSAGKKTKPSDVIYKIDQSRSPFGKFFKYSKDSSGSAEIDGNIFSQQDIDDRLIFFNNFNSNSSKILKIKVSDKKSNFESEFDFEVHPVKSNYETPMQAIQYGMMVLQNHAATITNDHLLVQVNGISSSNDIVYMITKKLLKEEGFLEHVNKPGIRLQSFTQNDIDNLKIVYHPPSYGAASEKQFMFQFVVIDAKSGSQLSPVQNFTITLTPPNSDFTSPASSIDYESNILLTQGGSIELGNHWLSTATHQMPDDQLEVVLTNAPTHGKLVQRIGGDETVLEEGEGFSFSSIIQDTFYDHDGSNSLHDSAIFSIMGGRHSTVNRVTFEMTPYDRESPVILDSTTLMGSVTEGQILTLQRHHLAFTDLISGDADIMFTLLYMPKFGLLEKQQNGNFSLLKPNDQFTQQDINKNLIRYTANIGIGDDTVREFLYFDVSDASGNVQSKQVLTVKVKPRIKEPPVLKVISDILVNEGGEAVIQPHILTVFDPDSPLSDLVVVIDKQPDYGFIENSRPILGAENSLLAGIPISSFPYVDLVEGYVKYIQAGHQGLEPDKDTIYIHILDGRLSSVSHLVNITIKPVNDETPHVFTSGLSVFSRGYIKLSNSTLSIVDADTKPDHLIITLDIPPQNGIIKKLKPGSLTFDNSKTIFVQGSFSFQDVLDGLVLYVHENFQSSDNDTFSLIVSDGQHAEYASLHVYVIQSDREVPFLLRNLGLELMPGNSSIIDNNTLRASDADSPDDSLLYIVTTYPTAGQLILFYNGQFHVLSSRINQRSKLPTFTQNDINLGHLKYRHTLGELIGLHFFKFNVKDPANNTLLDQTFFISISEDIFPPIITRNSGLKVSEKGRGCINSDMLAAVDEHKKSLDLVVTVTAAPELGYLELDNKKKSPVSRFLISDVEEGKVCYVHSSLNSLPLDSFTFTITDGRNSVLQTFYINITSKYDGIPAVKISPLIVKEGSKKIITEFEIDIYDKDTKDKNVLIYIIKPPLHGLIKNQDGLAIDVFSMHDIKQNKVYYWHDDSETTNDSFTMTVSDGSNVKIVLLNKNNNFTSENSVEFPIKIIQVDDVSPVLITNYGVKSLKMEHNNILETITNSSLLTADLDTSNENIVYRITLLPKLGFLSLSSKERENLTSFTQKDINEGKLQYILYGDNRVSTEDKFIFSVEDSNRNKITNNIFTIEWTRVGFNFSIYNASESQGILKIPLTLSGYADSFIEVICDIFALHSPNNIKDGISPLITQVTLGGTEASKECLFKINDNTEFEGKKQFKITLESPTLYGLYHEAIVDVFDEEDEPVISFTQAVYKVNETGKYFHFPVIRKGDNSQELSLICETNSLTAQGNSKYGLESGTDFRSRFYNYNSFITFPIGSNEVWCSVEIIDDNLFEEEEIFELKLSYPHPVGKLHGNTTAHVIISGPNDVPQVSFKRQIPQIYYGQSNISVTVTREGVDLSKNSTVMCVLMFSTAAEKNVTLFHEIKFSTFETIVEFELSFTPFESNNSADESILVFLNLPTGCVLKEPNLLNVPLKRKRINPSVEFSINHLTIKEDSLLISIPIKRTGDLSQNSSIYCITHDDTAVSRKDFEERYVTRKTSLIAFSPEQKESNCIVKIYDDDIHEGLEKFKVELVPYKKDADTVIGKNRIIVIEITDSEDATIIQLEKSEYIIDKQIFPSNISTSVIIPVMRYGDVKLISKVRVSTIDGSASSGLDYYGKSKLLTFFSGEKKKNFEIEILYNKRRNWALSFTVILGPDEVLNANIGNLSKAVVRIASVQSTESLILPAVPIVISLLHFDNVTKGMMENPKSGYPLICVTPCDENYPDYTATSALCKDSAMNSSSMRYSWEIAMPLGKEKISNFEMVTYSTLFTSAHHKVLDSIYFRPQERIRCVVQPTDSKGFLGIPLRSKMVKISSEIGFCHSTIQTPYSPLSLQSQPFIASLEYLNSSDSQHPNTLHIHIEIPHEDGLLPLISTYPLHNLEFLLTQNIYRQQHVCSNIQISSANLKKKRNFLKSLNPDASDVDFAFPYHGDQCEKDVHLLYQHLDLKKCKWSFDAWYTMTELVELCGGSVTSDFKARDTDQTYLTVLLPLYVTYAFAAAPTGWTSVEHRTEMEFSFFYDTFLWKSGSHFDNSINATLAVVRVGTNLDGHMFFEFKTVAKFYGCFVLDHHTLPDMKSYVAAPSNIDVQFDLELLWSEQTFDSPMQFWRATSNYNLKDYSGDYTLHLIPCKILTSEQLSIFSGQKYLPCIAQMPEKFELPLAFQQTNRPSPVTYALETFFQLFNNEKPFLMNPFENSPSFQYIEYKEAFSTGDNIYGRVFWSPKQGLESAYKLNINEIILCAGKNDYVPTYDPTGLTYGKGPQYGCLLPTKNLKYKFVLLDKHHPDTITREIQGIPFNAKFVDEMPKFASLSNTPGVDGFVFNIDPLYQISTSQQWFLQVIYHIKPTLKSRIPRSLDQFEHFSTVEHNGSNIKVIFIERPKSDRPVPIAIPVTEDTQNFHLYFEMHHLLYIISTLLIILGIYIIRSKSNFKNLLTLSKTSNNSYAFTGLFEALSLRNAEYNQVCEIQCKQKLKQKETYRIKVHTPRNDLRCVTHSSSETEV